MPAPGPADRRSMRVRSGHAVKLSGTRYGSIPGVAIHSSDTNAVNGWASNLDTFSPILVRDPIAVDAFIAHITTAEAAKTAYYGLYAADGDWMPTGPLIASGSVSVATTGTKTVTFTEVVLAPGAYLLAVNVDGDTAQCRRLYGSIPGSGAWLTFGQINGTATSYMLAQLRGTRTAGAMPATPTAPTAATESVVGFWVCALRVAPGGLLL